MHDDDIDRAIDDVARELTAGEPDGAFRARVMARIERGASGRGWWAWALSPVPMGALILIALATAWLYRSPERLALQRIENLVLQRTEKVAQPPAEKRAVPPTETLALQRRERPEVRPTETRAQQMETTAGARQRETIEGARAVAAGVERVASTGVASLAPPPLSVPSIVLAPIDRGDSIQLRQLDPIAPIDVAPLAVEPES